MTDEQVELEIAKLKASADVKLARLEQRIKYKRRQKLYTLRNLEKRGKALRESGITEKILKGMDEADEEI